MVADSFGPPTTDIFPGTPPLRDPGEGFPPLERHVDPPLEEVPSESWSLPVPTPSDPNADQPQSMRDAIIRAAKTLLQAVGAGGGVLIAWHELKIALGAAAISLALNILDVLQRSQRRSKASRRKATR